MKALMFTQRILCALAMLAVLLGPVSVTAAAAAMVSSGPMTGMEMADQSSDEEAIADMPCCPQEQKLAGPDCMKACPLALVCSTVIIGNLSTAEGLPMIHPLSMAFPGVAERQFASAPAEPLPRPPRA
ncbi:hypothetical protein G6M78_00615 [Agrobacterium tumefaciens]|uniref:Uncharacterized protein n=1 Tax=Agrobacterium tumefaciens TaxID=358 RepID=A0AA44JAG6_AGRTU|nr:hypothetical protein [Agrobacterium tumefaciens]NSY09628.1 hypothetical protein [Agrobacterium tumefaciens]NSZ09318.1 hypothetical protein [Agrobacterium tumefaciens]NTB87918.1 hypothetical protein [Agrobacterium tumefaciens]NTC20076.1 hypothetical protein [Agrobacterium tumefaciens]NTC31165.1 hypothetical protein [Agrobacterium tumefaciens]